jgi:aryl-alcohol dehydrogenase-like predicted oxidoreductase
VLRETVAGLVAAGQVDAGLVDPDDPLGFLREVAGSEVDAAYRFCRHEPGAQVVLTGTGSRAHLAANIAAILAPPLPDETRARLAAIFGRVDSVSGN